MARALELARRGLGYTSPNPCVGAVLWKGGKIIGEGYHTRAGRPHAEVEAVRDARKRGNGARIAGATLYVTLEPCSTVGRTPACTDLIRREKIARVVVAARDPNPDHAGAGFEILRRAGVNVSTGLLAEESAGLNHAFNHWIVTRRPWVTAKIARSLDGKIAARAGSGDDRWLTGPESRRLAHELRRESDAIVVGGETVRQDNPKLTIRLPGRRKPQPWRIVWSRSGDFPAALHLFSDAHRERTRRVRGSLKKIMAELGSEEITHVLLEGGGHLLAEAFAAGIVNEVAFFIAPIALGTEAEAVAAIPGLPRTVALADPAWQKVGVDLFCRARVVPAPAPKVIRAPARSLR